MGRVAELGSLGRFTRMTHPRAQRLVEKLTGRRRSGESDCQLVRRHERRLFVFALLSACVGLPLVVAGYFLSERRSAVLLFWIAIAGLQMWLWLRCRRVRRFLEHHNAT